ncbi:hypothetical protein BKA63DRAFT_507454 [Paraphoma chrysanthemicola]|nr:hypothetical protein BKA63DRAFT_507454 [Paraphoma chrysanthemicola]
MNAASGMYLALKIVYTALYLNTTTQKMAYFRSLTWLTGVILLMGVYVKAGNALLSKV